MRYLRDRIFIFVFSTAVIATSGPTALAQQAGASADEADAPGEGEKPAVEPEAPGATEEEKEAEPSGGEPPPAGEPANQEQAEPESADTGAPDTAADIEARTDSRAKAKTMVSTRESVEPALAEPAPETAAAPSGEEPDQAFTQRLLFYSADGRIEVQPLAWVKPLFRLALGQDKVEVHENTGFELKEARFGIDASLFEWGSLYSEFGLEEGTGQPIETYLDVDPFDGAAVLRAGLFYTFFGRQNLMTTTQYAMVDEAMALYDEDLGLDLDSDLGAAIHGMALGGLEYGAGVWNGEKGFSSEGNIDFELGGRIAVHPLALAGAGETVPIGNESDPEASAAPGLVLGVAALYDKRHDRIVPIGELEQPYHDNRFKLGVEAAFKYVGLSVQWELFLINTWVQDDADERIKQAVAELDETIAPNIDGQGISTYLQAAYFVLPRRMEIVGRFDMVDEDTELRGSRFHPAIGGTYYLYGNNLKGQLMYRLNVTTGYEDTDPGYLPTSHDVFFLAQASI